MGLLVLFFRQIERWLHRHIFKVGWLLTNDFQTTTVLYYIIFLPGIMLHELTLWLAAGVLNVRAEGELKFPKAQHIGELRPSFIRLAPATSDLKRILISLSPLVSGLAALWAISVTLFPASQSLAMALPSSVNELGAAISAMTRTANFWLWLYIVFTIANRAFPTLPVKLSARQKFLLMMTLPALCFGLWRAANAANPAIALGIEGLLSGLTLIIAQITLLNIGCVLVLGAIEAVIERLTSRIATFRDGRMITKDSKETEPARAGLSQEGPIAPKRSATRNSAPATSIYDMKLPIPGPPGREPVSRQAVAVVSLERPAADDAAPGHEIVARPKTILTLQPSPTVNDESAQEQTNPLSNESEGANTETDSTATGGEPQQSDTASEGKGTVGEIRQAAAEHDAVAPFVRPFAETDAPSGARDDWDEQVAESAREPFARPFVMSTRSDLPYSAADSVELYSDLSYTNAEEADADNTDKESQPTSDRQRTSASQTRPAPKPSQKAKSEFIRSKTVEADELEYEDLDEIDAYDQDDGRYDDEL